MARTTKSRLNHRSGLKPVGNGQTSAQPEERALAFLEINQRQEKPREIGLTEIRGPYYTPMGRRYLEDLLETMGCYVDSLKFAGGSFSLMPHKALKQLVDLCHAHDVLVSTGGFIERVLTLGSKAVDQYVNECKRIGFDIVEISSGFITVPHDDLVRLTEKVQKAGLRACHALLAKKFLSMSSTNASQ